MIVPEKITIQIIDKEGNPNAISDVLFGCNVFVSEDAWHPFSPIKSEASGQVTITREEIIGDIAYTSFIPEENLLAATPTYFEIHVWGGQFTVDLIQNVHRLLISYADENAIKESLKQEKILEANIPVAIQIINNKAVEDRAFYERIKNAVNNSVCVENDKIRGVWEDAFPKKYEFIIQRTETGK